jgi:bifunctional hydroxylase/dehydrase
MDFGVFDGAHFGVRGVLQARTEAILAEWAEELGADIRRGWEFVGLADEGDGITVEVNGPNGFECLRASYLVGCDGGHSSVRKEAGFNFPGTAANLEMFLADVRGADLRPRFIGEKVRGGMVMAAPLGGDIDRIIVCEEGSAPVWRTGSPNFGEVADAWQRLTGEDIHGCTAPWVSAFTNATHQATEYRRGRVLLAGDAAHIHLPAGGQGLSVGVQDAVNLGWKLAGSLHGWAPDGLLDSYYGERHTVGARLLMNTQAQGLLYLSGDEVQSLREVMAELISIDAVGRHLAGMVSGLEIRYDVGSDDHPLLGRRIPRQELVSEAGKTSTIDLLHSARGVLLDFADDAALRRAASSWADRIDIVTVTPHAIGTESHIAGIDAVLVRPDGYVMWLTPGCDELPSALRQWFGSPRNPDSEITEGEKRRA